MHKPKTILPQSLFSLSLLLLYLSGCVILANLANSSWARVSISLFLIEDHVFWVRYIAFLSILSGIALIYFVPGIFIVRNISPKTTDKVEIFAKGFLVNYFFYFGASSLYKLFFGLDFTREIMVVLIVTNISVNLALELYSRSQGISYWPLEGKNFQNKAFIFLYLSALFLIIYLCKEKIFYYGFFDENEGSRQFWAAYSLRQQVLPTFYNERFTFLAGFPFAPTIYLNSFAIILFGENGLSVRLEVLVAFACLGFILKELIKTMRGRNEFFLYEYLPLFLYLIIYFMIIAYRGGYDPPTEIAKSSETVLITLFFTGFYLLLKNSDDLAILSAVFLFLASMVRYNEIAVAIPLLLLFKYKKCLSAYFVFWFISILLLNLIIIISPYNFSFQDMLFFLKKGFLSSQVSNHPIDLRFAFEYLKKYFLLSAGLSIFFIITIKNKYSRVLLLTSALYLLLPLKAIYIPAHFFAPVLFFPIISYYLWK